MIWSGRDAMGGIAPTNTVEERGRKDVRENNCLSFGDIEKLSLSVSPESGENKMRSSFGSDCS
jgi:hypothetical protein